MIDILDKHIDAQVEAYKSNRYEDSSSEGMSFIQRFLKRNHNENYQSVFSSNQKGWQGSDRLEVWQHPDPKTKRN